MDPIPGFIATAVASALVITVGVLWQRVSASNARCEEGRIADRKEMEDLKRLILERSRADVEKAEAREAAAAAREVRASERAVQIATILENAQEVFRWGIRVLKRYDPRGGEDHDKAHETPPPGEATTALIPKHREGETSEFHQDPRPRKGNHK